MQIISSIAAFFMAHAFAALIVLLCVNLVTFALFGIDKKRAQRGEWRIPESTLLTAAALFGATGAFTGMRVFRHKTKHRKFTILVPMLLVLQAALLVWLLVAVL